MVPRGSLGLALLLPLLHTTQGVNFPVTADSRTPLTLQDSRTPLTPDSRTPLTLQHCTDVSSSGASSTAPVTVTPGSALQFTSPGYDGSSLYSHQAKCVWTFVPAAGSQLRFSCSAFDLVASSAPGQLCKGDFLRIYDEGVSGSLGSSGDRFCHSQGPAFVYGSPVNVLFNTNNDGAAATGFDCIVAAEFVSTTTTTASTTSTTTTTMTTTTARTSLGTQSTTTTTTMKTTKKPPRSCLTDPTRGPRKPCLTFKYRAVSAGTTYRGCINLKPPKKRAGARRPPLANDTVLLSEEDFLEREVLLAEDEEVEEEPLEMVDYQEEEEDVETNFGLAPRMRGTESRKRGQSKRPGRGSGSRAPGRGNKKPRRTHSLFWCATEVGRAGGVVSWQPCSNSCKADPRGSFLPAGPSDKSKTGVVRAERGQKVGKLASIIRRRNRRLGRSN